MNVTRPVAAVFLAAILVSELAACGSPASSLAGGSSARKPGASPSTADPLATLTALQVFDEAITDTDAAPDAHYSLSGVITGPDSASGVQDVEARLAVARGRGCTGTVYLDSLKQGPLGTLQVVTVGSTIWTQPDATYWQNVVSGHRNTPGAASLLALTGKYVQDSTIGTSGFAQLDRFCVLAKALKTPLSVGMTGKLTKDGVSQYNGQQVLTIMDVAQNAYAVVTDTSAPLLLEVEPPSGTGLGNLTFSDYGQRVTITPPPVGEVVDGSEYGL